MKKVILILLVIVLIATSIVLLKKRRQTVVSAPKAAPVSYTIKTVVPQQQTISETGTFLAQLQAENSAAISSKLSGRIGQVLVEENQLVKPGDLLVRIDDQEVKSTIAALQAKLGAARRQQDYNDSVYQRNLALFKVGGLSQEKLDASELAYRTAAAAVEELQQNLRGLKTQLDYFNIRAPFSGIVGTIMRRQGDLATPGLPLLTVNSLPQKLTFSFVPASDELSPGQNVLLDGRQIGAISKIYDDASNGLSVAEVKLDQRLGRPNGSYLTVEVVTGRGSGCTVPVQALLHRKSGVSLMVYQNGHFVETPARVRIQNRAFALLDSCPTAGVAVASEAKLSLLPGYGNIKVAAGEQHE
jgi:RND family efflux transporter MFP subunit